MNNKLEIANRENLTDYESEEEGNSLGDLYLYNDNEDDSSIVSDDMNYNSIWTNIERDLDDFIDNLLQ